MTPIYLSPDNPRWTPATEVGLQAAVDQRLIGESHYVDLKEMSGSKADNKEAAKDMASFAIDCGTLIYGIGEDKANRTFFLAPQPLKGLAEKLEQIARSSPDPPLTVLTEEIASDTDPTCGYLIVHIPASPVAPHMVDNRYWVRGDKTKYALSDPEVIRLHERRQRATHDTVALLGTEILNDPIPAEIRQNAHLFLVAQPAAGRRDMLLDLVSGPEWNLGLEGFLRQAAKPELTFLLRRKELPPTIFQASNGYRRARGAARSTPNLGEGRVYQQTQQWPGEDAIELQVHEDGGLRLLFTRLSDTMTVGSSQATERMLLDMTAVSLCRRFLALVLAAGEHAGYFGNWELGLAATRLRGLRAYNNTAGFATTARYDADDYLQTTSVSWSELNRAPGAVTRRLVGPLLRALATEERYAAILTDPASATT